MSVLYATLDLSATVVVAGHWLGFSPVVVTLVGAALCFGLRFLAIRRHWQLPMPPKR